MHEKAGRGEQRFLTLFIPLGAKDANPLKKITQKGNSGAEVRFTDGTALEVEIKNNKLSAKIK